jgi:type I restriction enzyme S subunit
MGTLAVVSEISSEDEGDILPTLPKGWICTTLGIVSTDPQYGWTTKATDEGSLHFLRTTDITSGIIEWDTVPFCTDEPAIKEKYILKDGDIVISRAGSVGYSQLIKKPQNAVFASYLIRFRPLIDEDFFAYFLKSPRYWRIISEQSIGIALQNVNASKLKQIIIPLPPLPEQHRIVTKIEELLTQLDAGVASLKKVQAQLKRYRQAVLKAAFEGRLTQEWREEHKGKIEPVDVLIDRINQARKKTAFNKNEETPSAIPDVQSLPDSWNWMRLDNIAFIKGGITKDSKRIVENGRVVPYLRVANVQNGYLDLNEMKTIVADENEIKNLSLRYGDILFTEGGDRDKLGRGWIWQDQIPDCIYQNHIFRARLYLHEISSKYVSWFGNTHSQKYFMKKGKQTTNLASISLTQLRAFPVALAPIEEQEEIVKEIERYFSQIDHLEKTIITSLRQAETLRQSILKQAFEGKLAPQDPNDEPASVLLERIKAEKLKGKTLQPKSPKRKIKNAN